MSLGDGLARALQRYMQAKDEVGLRALLVGDKSEDSGKIGTPSAETQGRANGNGNGKKQDGRKTNGHADGSTPRKAKQNTVKLDSLRFQRQQEQFKVICPDCQGELRYSEGCETCQSCGYSMC